MNPITLLNNKIQLSQWMAIMHQLRPSVTAEDINSLISWRYHFLTSLRNNEIVGVGTYFPTASLVKGKYHYLADFVVDSKYRRKGVGASMMEEIFSSNLPCELDSGLQRTDSHRFYEKLGFVSNGYAVRLKAEAFATMSHLSHQQADLIDAVHQLQKQDENQIKRIQTFIDEYAALKTLHHSNLQLFMKEHPDHQLLILQDKTNEVEGILLYELQNRLSIGGNCFYVSDLIVKNGLEIQERQNALLVALARQIKACNLHDHKLPIKSIIVEMTEEDVRSHGLIKPNEESESAVTGSLEKKLNIHSIFSVTARHFAWDPESPRAPGLHFEG